MVSHCQPPRKVLWDNIGRALILQGLWFYRPLTECYTCGAYMRRRSFHPPQAFASAHLPAHLVEQKVTISSDQLYKLKIRTCQTARRHVPSIKINNYYSNEWCEHHILLTNFFKSLGLLDDFSCICHKNISCKNNFPSAAFSSVCINYR